MAKPPEEQDDQILIESILAASDPTSKTDLSAAVLERALRRVDDQRKTERFFWAGGAAVLLNTFVAMTSPAALIGIIPLQLVLLIGLANWLEVDFVKKPLTQLFERNLKRK